MLKPKTKITVLSDIYKPEPKFKNVPESNAVGPEK